MIFAHGAHLLVVMQPGDRAERHEEDEPDEEEFLGVAEAIDESYAREQYGTHPYWSGGGGDHLQRAPSDADGTRAEPAACPPRSFNPGRVVPVRVGSASPALTALGHREEICH